MRVVIDKDSGFCFGVVHAIEAAEKALREEGHLFCLGDIVHNNEEVRRLEEKGLQIIDEETFDKLRDARVLIRAHGEPPRTYAKAEQNRVELIDATCQVVLKLQRDIAASYRRMKAADGQVVIYGKQGHAEVVGLLGQTCQEGIVVSSVGDLDKVDFHRPAVLYSQTTQSVEEYTKIIAEMRSRFQAVGLETLFEYHDTICRRVANRARQIQEFAVQYEAVIFVSGEKSSNGLYLFDLCRQINPRSYFVSHLGQLDDIPFEGISSVGICGATSTPMWLMQRVAEVLAAK
ncbi:MAG: 4-hydroxy-3-methylbut-2-enyl diphosphate reductase [Bacteroidales bacterium]|nr:4-hydroxy-3-methylbut-2-enyl diphosphate reductase [Bacteroidales bacterium]